jgi:hypothetical protein
VVMGWTVAHCGRRRDAAPNKEMNIACSLGLHTAEAMTARGAAASLLRYALDDANREP